jgi:hypothetical protein
MLLVVTWPVTEKAEIRATIRNNMSLLSFMIRVLVLAAKEINKMIFVIVIC